MDLKHFIEGYLIGFSVGTTIGISGILCLQNMMTGQVSLGIASVLAAAFSDMTCAIFALFGLEFLQTFLMPYKTGLSIVTGLFLCGIGVRRIFGKINFDIQHTVSPHIFAAFSRVFFLGLIDPVSVLDFLALSLGLTLDFSVVHKVYQFIAGVFLGSFSWWIMILFLVFALEKGLSSNVFDVIQRLVGAVVLFLGIWTLWLINA